ncbi:hypothetical protein E0Z10_g10648 [Xylaria hypoxylon]|uniref:Major facilitator superfamily (MFS) profile domain-containing protein n=1 Tax=Xylaria hypoxylon TaxID=37992 RepID=A0A4Z0YDY4_9PEZI|nr:hypothetical protein E0Z10_g10648 [Xylaria hypoxylon]
MNSTSDSESHRALVVPKRDQRFWFILGSFTVAALVSSLEAITVFIALPTISGTLQLGHNYVWVISVYFLMRNIFADMMICDLAPLSDRGIIHEVIFAAIRVGLSFGPLIGGILASVGQWRWIFFLNLPVGAVLVVALYVFLRVSHQRKIGWRTHLRRIDYVGNLILVASTILILYVLTYAGSKYPWNSQHIKALLVVDLMLMAVFFVYERSSLCSHPLVPAIPFSNQTSSASLFISFIHSILLTWATYMYPLYLQSVLNASPARSGINLVIMVHIFLLFTVLGTTLLARTGEYKYIQIIGLTILTVAIGASSVSIQSSWTGNWPLLETVVAASLGVVTLVLRPAFEAELTKKEAASSSGTWALIRSLGAIGGISIPAAIFNNRAEQLSFRVSDPSARKALEGGRAYGHGTAAFLDRYAGETREQLVSVYADALREVWQIGVVFACLALFAALYERRVKPHKDNDTQFGPEKIKKGTPSN